ncbi:hypothetical protein AXG93_4530s1100 [Marchantia polymorpha subsp. ruderalis]|uniref:Dirigent protein n=1 Tax=Marchantia polymorpha subsp. ruderalis TaxID=1480154 RepID=A0A176VUC7_MARPO|nr:hypothetical protein AXG93_4530s1100 [Marchantia polymorpha subsp. ruderalis]
MARSRASSGLDGAVVKTAIIVLLGLCSLQNVVSTSSRPRNPSFVLYAVRNGNNTANPSEVQIYPATATPPRLYITGVVDLITLKDSKNGTISTAGIQTALTVGAIDEFPILGGSGEYRFSSGYIKFTLLSPVDARGTTLLGKLEFYLCKSSSCHD